MMKPRVCMGLMAIALLLGAGRSLACDLLPKFGNPFEVQGVEITRLARLVNANFNAGERSERNYDLVNPLDGMTLGFGNWPQAEVEGFFADMKSSNGGKAFATFTDCMTEFFALKTIEAPDKKNKQDVACHQVKPADAWRQAQERAGVGPAAPTREHVAAVLEKTLLNKDFMKQYKKNCYGTCKRRQADMYHTETWLVPALCYALRDRSVVEWQAVFWTRTIVDDGIKMATAVGLGDDEASLITAASYRSSAPAWFDPVIKAAKTGKLSFEEFTWRWNVPPEGAARDAEGLKKWRRLILWQHYAANVWRSKIRHKHKPSLRTRSIEVYKTYLAADWRLPALDKHGLPIANKRSNLNPALVRPKP